MLVAFKKKTTNLLRKKTDTGKNVAKYMNHIK